MNDGVLSVRKEWKQPLYSELGHMSVNQLKWGGEAHRQSMPEDEAKAPTPSPRLQLVPFNEVLITTTTHYLVKNLIPREGLVVVWGPPKCGKSFWAFDLAMHIALGWLYRGRRVAQGPVAYIACEGASGFRARIEAFRQRFLAEEAEDVPFFLVPQTLDLIAECNDLIAAIEAGTGWADDGNPSVVVIDTLNRSMRGSENSDEDMAAYIRAADAIRERFSCAVIIVHHCGIEGSRPRGHTSLTGACEAQIAVKRDTGGIITATLEWQKDGPEGDVVHSRLEAIEIGTDDDGETMTSCVIVPEKMAGASTARKLTGATKIAFDFLQRAIVDAGEIPTASNHIPRTNKVVRGALWRSYCDKGSLTTSDNPDTKNRVFVRAYKRLQELGAIGVWDDLVWIVRTSRTSPDKP